MPLFTGRADSFHRSRFPAEVSNGWLPTGAIHIGTRARREKSVLIAGLGGSLWYNGGENQFREFQIALRILRLFPRLLYNRLRFGRYLDILLTHAPPFGIHDKEDRCHRGFKVFLWFMRVLRPKYLVHGHIHLYSASELRISRYQQTTVVNAYDHVVIDMEVPGMEIPG